MVILPVGHDVGLVKQESLTKTKWCYFWDDMLKVGQESTYNKQHQSIRVANIDSRIFKISLLWNGESLANNNINIYIKKTLQTMSSFKQLMLLFHASY